MVENQRSLPYTEPFLAESSFQCFVERFKRKTKSYFLNHIAKNGGKENEMGGGGGEGVGGMSFHPLEPVNEPSLIEQIWTYKISGKECDEQVWKGHC